MSLIVAGELLINSSSSTEIALLEDVRYDDTHDVDPEAEEELQKLELKKFGLKQRLDEADMKIIRVNSALLSTNQDLVRILNDLELEHDLLAREILMKSLSAQEREEKITSEEKEEEAAREAAKEEAAKEEAEWKPVKDRISQKVKKLFREIAAKTHPDKTRKDTETVREEKQRLFMAAMKARDDNDYAALVTIASKLKFMRSTLLSHILDQLGLTRIEIKDLEKDIKIKLGSIPYSMASDYESSDKFLKGLVTVQYRKMLESHAADLKQQIRELDPTRYAAPKFRPWMGDLYA